MTYNAIDLFCGCGGFSQGINMSDSGINILAGIDIWNKAINNYKKNHSHEAICEDLQKLPPEIFEKKYNKDNKKIDIIFGSPPCQSYSMSGKRDKNDPRSLLYLEFVKYVDFYKPKAFMMENVIGLLSIKTNTNEKIIDIILKCFEKDYNCIVCKLFASDFYVPQNRRRVIIIGIKKELNKIPTEPKPLLTLENRIAVKTILTPRDQINEKYFLSKKAIDGIKRRKEVAKSKGNGFGVGILDMDKPSYTISARYWKDGYDALVKYDDNKLRRLTIPELKKIQSFPDDYILEGSNKEIITQIGNAVACTFSKHLGKHLISILQ